MPFPTGLALGLAQGGMSALGAFGQYSSGQAAAAARNRQAMKIYKQQLRNYANDFYTRNAGYKNKISQYQMQQRYNQSAAQRAYESEQERINEIFKQAQFARQGSQIDLAAALGQGQAIEQSGRSAQRRQALIQAGAGRNEAIRNEQLRQSIMMSGARNRYTQEDLAKANKDAYFAVGARPVPGAAPIAPTMQRGPSTMSLLTGLGSAALSGATTGMKFANYDPSEGGGADSSNTSYLSPLFGQIKF